jgi:hypothetical protein
MKIPSNILQDNFGWVHLAQGLYGGRIVRVCQVEAIIPKTGLKLAMDLFCRGYHFLNWVIISRDNFGWIHLAWSLYTEAA